MSEFIQNEQGRKEEIKRIIRSIDSGEDVASAKASFTSLLRTISPEEIADVEQSLIAEGMPVEQVRSLCDLHVEAFESTLKQQKIGRSIPGHPVDTYRKENKEAKPRAKALLRAAKKLRRGIDDGSFSKQLETLRGILIHYTRKENQLFPFLERVGFTGPSQVMWAKHDEIRDLFKDIRQSYVQGHNIETSDKSRDLVSRLRKMIFMEERILFPTAMKKLPEATWAEIRRGEAEIGYAWIAPGNLWDPNVLSSGGGVTKVQSSPETPETSETPAKAVTQDEHTTQDNTVNLRIGELTFNQIDMLLRNLPVDVTFVDEDDRVRFYSDSAERIFPRSPGIIGRSVQNCHPPKSVSVVEKILESFKRHEKADAEFWLEHNERFVHIRYIPVYDETDAYRGVIEVSQDITDLRKLEGSKTLLGE